MDRERLMQRTMEAEGYRNHMYKCPADKWTIGVGHNIEDRGLSDAAIMFILNEDLDICEDELRGSLSFWDEMPGEVQEALMDLCFNMGIARLLQFRKTLKHLKERKWALAAEELLDSRYAATLPNRAAHNANLIRAAGG